MGLSGIYLRGIALLIPPLLPLREQGGRAVRAIVRKIRLLRSRLLGGPPLGVWETNELVIHGGKYCAWRILASGECEYREATDEEFQGFREATVW
jgi:hypothetical protein